MNRKLPRHYVEKIWGVDALPPGFDAERGKRIGEVWFDPPAELSQLLAKYIFTSERLSVQNHPSDAQAREFGLGTAGKSECWVIMASETDAEIAVGFREEVSGDKMRSGALDGSIVEMLAWHSVAEGDVFYIPPGTVHAIGAGVNLIEIQQNSDVTFRLYDYGRPRELHLDQGLAVAQIGPYPAKWRSKLKSGEQTLLVDGPHFRLTYAEAACADLAAMHGPALVMPFAGTPSVDGETLGLGDCLLAEDLAQSAIAGTGSLLIAQPVTA